MPTVGRTWIAVSEMKTCWTQCEHPAVRSSVARPVSRASPVPPLAIEERARNERATPRRMPIQNPIAVKLSDSFKASERLP